MNEPLYVTEAKVKAAAVRHELSLGFEAIANIFHLLEENGLPVVRKNMEKDGPDGIYANDGKLAVAFINNKKPRNRRRFTAAHELAHHLFDSETGLRVDEDVFNLTDRREKRANSFAAHFLMPEEGIRKVLRVSRRRHVEARDVIHLSQHFIVSRQAMIFHLHNLGMISAADRDRFKKMDREKQFLSIEWEMGMVPTKKREPQDLLLPSDYVSRAIKAYLSNQITIKRLADLLSVDDEGDLQKELAAANLVPEAEPIEELLEDVEHA